MVVWKVFYPQGREHSIRIQTAMLLFETNAIDIQVMGQFQYKSTAFQMYYRNNYDIARIHTKAVELSDNYLSSPAVVIDDKNFEKDDADK